MKLKDWAKQQGISYLTAWRWFKQDDPRLSNAYQSNSGTIIVPEDEKTLESSTMTAFNNEAISHFLKKNCRI